MNPLEELRRFEVVGECTSLNELGDFVLTLSEDGVTLPVNDKIPHFNVHAVISGIKEFVPHRHFKVPVAWGIKAQCFYLYYKQKTDA